MHGTCELPVVPGGPEQEVPDPTDSGHPRQSFSSLAVPVCLGAAGRRVSLARGADDPGSPVDPALALVVESKVVGMAGRVGVGPIRQGNALRAGGSYRSAGRDRLRSNPLVRKKRECLHPHAHTRTPRARSTHEHVSLTSRSHVWRAYQWRCACVGMCMRGARNSAQHSVAQTRAHTLHSRTHSTATSPQGPRPLGIRSIAVKMFIIHIFNSVQPFSVVVRASVIHGILA